MGTWSQPRTEEKAKQLAKLMATPLAKKNACDLLYDLVGDDDLFDLIDELDSDSDVRFLVRDHLADTLNNLHLSRYPWEDNATAICLQLTTCDFYEAKWGQQLH
jgi:hypothetical protein